MVNTFWYVVLERCRSTADTCLLLLSPGAQSLKLVSSEQALKELGLNEHQLRFTCRVQLQDPHSDSDTLHRIYTHLKRCDRVQHEGSHIFQWADLWF